MTNRKNAKLASALIGAAVMPAAAMMMSPATAHGAINVVITNLGTPTTASGNVTLPNYVAYDITLTDTDGSITGIDLGQTVSGQDSVNGLYYTGTTPGGLLQQSTFTNPGYTNTPSSISKNAATPNKFTSLSFDSHIVVPSGNQVVVTAPFENSDNSNPLGSSFTNSNGDTTTGIDYGYGTYLKGLFGLSTQTPSVDLAYVVVPKTGGAFMITGTAGSTGSTNAETFTGSIGGSPTTGGGTHNIINLTSATIPAGNYGVQLTAGTGANQATFAPNAPVAGTINVTKVGANSYVPGFANGVSGATAGTGAIADFAQISGFAAGDQEIYALKLLVGSSAPTTTQMNSIVADIAGQSGDGVSTVASLLGSPSGLAGQIAGLFPGYDLMLTVTTGTATPFLGFDFSQETNVAGVVVTNIAAVPEPASAAILLIGSSLLLGRRKRNALMA